jgi:hypothetical protein
MGHNQSGLNSFPTCPFEAQIIDRGSVLQVICQCGLDYYVPKEK